MEITSKGNCKYKVLSGREAKCHRCKTKFVYKDEDLVEYGFDTDSTHYMVECPVCKDLIERSIFHRKVWEWR